MMFLKTSSKKYLFIFFSIMLLLFIIHIMIYGAPQIKCKIMNFSALTGEEIDPDNIKLPKSTELADFPNKTIEVHNEFSSEHEIENGHIAIYKNNGDNWNLKKGAVIKLKINTSETEDSFVDIGYIKDQAYVRCYHHVNILHKDGLNIMIPEDGDYKFYLLNTSAATIHLDFVEIKQTMER